MIIENSFILLLIRRVDPLKLTRKLTRQNSQNRCWGIIAGVFRVLLDVETGAMKDLKSYVPKLTESLQSDAGKY